MATADIERIEEFAKDGERSISGLTLTDGFPRYEKPARQWFNSILYTITTKVNTLVTMVNILKNTEDFGIGDIYVTTNNFTSGTEVYNRHGYGTWERFAQGRTLVGQSELSSDPSWTAINGSEFGDFNHTLTVEQSAPHTHTLRHGRDNGSTDNDAGTVASDTGNWSGQVITGDNVSTSGGGLPHNNTQPSVVVQYWLRVS